MNNELFKKTVLESKLTIPRLSALTGIPQSRIESYMEDGDTIKAAEIQALSNVLEMPNNLRRNIFFDRNLPLD